MLTEEISPPESGDTKRVPNFFNCQPWSHHDDAILTRLYKHDVIEELAELLGRTVKALYARANDLGLERASKNKGSSYEIRIIRAIDGMVMYSKTIPANYGSVSKKNIQMRAWHKMFEDKFITGEWEMSIINGFEQFT